MCRHKTAKESKTKDTQRKAASVIYTPFLKKTKKTKRYVLYLWAGSVGFCPLSETNSQFEGLYPEQIVPIYQTFELHIHIQYILPMQVTLSEIKRLAKPE